MLTTQVQIRKLFWKRHPMLASSNSIDFMNLAFRGFVVDLYHEGKISKQLGAKASAAGLPAKKKKKRGGTFTYADLRAQIDMMTKEQRASDVTIFQNDEFYKAILQEVDGDDEDKLDDKHPYLVADIY